MKILFICTANRDRSKTAEVHFSKKYPEHTYKSAGINKYLSERHGGIHVNRSMLDSADRVMCAEICHSDYIISKIDKKYNSKIEVLHLGDTEEYMSKDLITKLEEKFNLY